MAGRSAGEIPDAPPHKGDPHVDLQVVHMLAPAAHDALLQEPNGSFAKLCELACKLNVWWRTIELLLNLILTLTLTLTLNPTLTRHATNAPHIHGEDGGQPWTGKPELLERFAHVCESGCDDISDAAYDTQHYAAVVLAMDQAFEATNTALQRHGMLDNALQVPTIAQAHLPHLPHQLTSSPSHRLTASPPTHHPPTTHSPPTHTHHPPCRSSSPTTEARVTQACATGVCADASPRASRGGTAPPPSSTTQLCWAGRRGAPARLCTWWTSSRPSSRWRP